MGSLQGFRWGLTQLPNVFCLGGLNFLLLVVGFFVFYFVVVVVLQNNTGD